MSELTSTHDTARYPLFSLTNALEVGAAVRDCGGTNGDVPKASIAHALNTSDSSGGFLQRLLTARAFGIIEGRGKYRLTDIAKRYFDPTEEGAAQQAQLSFFSAPPVFSELIKKFDGQKLPPVAIISNILQREMGVAKSWKDRVVSNFTKTAQTVGALDGSGFLRYRSIRHAMNAAPKPPPTFNDPPPPLEPATPPPQSTPRTATQGRFSMSIPYGDTFAYLETPQRDKLDLELWEMLNAAIQMLKPKI